MRSKIYDDSYFIPYKSFEDDLHLAKVKKIHIIFIVKFLELFSAV